MSLSTELIGNSNGCHLQIRMFISCRVVVIIKFDVYICTTIRSATFVSLCCGNFIRRGHRPLNINKPVQYFCFWLYRRKNVMLGYEVNWNILNKLKIFVVSWMMKYSYKDNIFFYKYCLLNSVETVNVYAFVVARFWTFILCDRV